MDNQDQNTNHGPVDGLMNFGQWDENENVEIVESSLLHLNPASPMIQIEDEEYEKVRHGRASPESMKEAASCDGGVHIDQLCDKLLCRFHGNEAG
ncbi:hypothetical protein Sjap_004327 [Stephania japonica]|uniref:Uncharacterized protein n=1 Tax=Stephania japonica TaxID=461633 RepID=A0AAP0K355_9MAGN